MMTYRYARYVPAAAKFAVAHHATEKYAPQVTLDGDGYLKNYVAGMPFPLIDVTDPAAAMKIAYNWHMGWGGRYGPCCSTSQRTISICLLSNASSRRWSSIRAR